MNITQELTADAVREQIALLERLRAATELRRSTRLNCAEALSKDGTVYLARVHEADAAHLAIEVEQIDEQLKAMRQVLHQLESRVLVPSAVRR